MATLPVTAVEPRAFCIAILPKVSRTFAICIRLLPSPLEYSVLVAYLLCRIADTIEDTVQLAPADKVRLLHHFRDCLAPDGPGALPIARAFGIPGNDEERLTSHTDTVLGQFRALPQAHRHAIGPWVQEMCTGMAEFAARAEPHGRLGALATVEELERYCYYVAGTVGHLLTELFRQHTGRLEPGRYRRLTRLATSFGLGLQLTNIIKDVAEDRRRGWTFVPQQLCQLVGLRPEDLQDQRHRESARRVMHQLIEKAKTHLLDALEYSTSLPPRAYRIRLFCLTALYFAVRTLRLAEAEPRLLDPHHKVKITRAQVYRTIAVTRLLAPANALVRAYFRLLAGEAWWHGRQSVPMVTG